MSCTGDGNRLIWIHPSGILPQINQIEAVSLPREVWLMNLALVIKVLIKLRRCDVHAYIKKAQWSSEKYSRFILRRDSHQWLIPAADWQPLMKSLHKHTHDTFSTFKGLAMTNSQHLQIIEKSMSNIIFQASILCCVADATCQSYILLAVRLLQSRSDNPSAVSTLLAFLTSANARHRWQNGRLA